MADCSSALANDDMSNGSQRDESGDSGDERGESDAALACAPDPATAAADAASAGDDRKHGTLFFPCFFFFSLSLCIVFFPCFFFLSPLSLYLNVSPRS